MRKCAVIVLIAFAAGLGRADDTIPEPTQRPDATFRLFRSQNVYNFLKLDTRNGKVWQVQWGGSQYRWFTPINLIPLAVNGKPGRFTLVPTLNVYMFLLIDQEDGRVWEVQWGNKAEDRFIEPIDAPLVQTAPDSPATQ